jgi:predicted PurR-regulated permease PerM
MPLTLNQFLLLVITLAVVVAVTYLVMLSTQLKKTAKEGERTLIELNALVKRLQHTSEKIDVKVDDMDEIVQATKKTAIGLAEATTLFVTRIIRPSSRYWPFLFPVMRLGLRVLKKKKKKEAKNGR